jgi:GNAT superfamily N-acetyltransferase
MESVTVRVLGVDQWREYRTVRLAALKDSPHAFSSSLDEELTHDEQQWRACMVRAHRLQAERDGAPVGVVSVGPTADEEGSADVFGLWVDSAARNTGVAWGLVEAACDQALKSGWGHLYYWVGTQNGRAIGFASNFGFRPTSHRRTARTPCVDCGEHQEIAMVLSLPSNAGVPNPMGPRLISQPGPAGGGVS